MLTIECLYLPHQHALACPQTPEHFHPPGINLKVLKALKTFRHFHKLPKTE